jgi:hypothetical protein
MEYLIVLGVLVPEFWEIIVLPLSVSERGV